MEQPTRNNGADDDKRTPVMVYLHPVEYGVFAAAAKTRGHSTVQGALQEFLDRSSEVFDWQNNGFQIDA